MVSNFRRTIRTASGEAKRLLKLAMVELRKDRSLIALGMDPLAEGRGAITGRGASSVWDFLSLRDRPMRSSFIAFPHLTLSVRADELEAAITIPNGVITAIRRRLAALGAPGLIDLNAQILKRARRLTTSGATVGAYAVQRHYQTQSSGAVIDARVGFDLSTSVPCRSGAVKHRPEWVGVFAELLRTKRGNVQFGYVVQMPWRTKGLRSRQSLR